MPFYEGKYYKLNAPQARPPALCKLRELTPTFRDFVRHIAECKHPECRDVLNNHIELCEHFGVNFQSPPKCQNTRRS